MRKALLLALVAFATSSFAAVPSSQRDALIAFYQSTNGPAWTSTLNWLGAPGTECTWHGVGCDDGEANVVALELPANNLQGAFPASLAGLPKLVTLNLAENGLTGALPPQLGQLSDLGSFYASHNQLTGRIPDEFGNLKKLQYLGLNDNGLEGPLPSALGGMLAMIDLDLSFNAITGAIPASFGNFIAAERISLSSNQVTGAIPKDLGSLAKIEILSLSVNQLDGAIPPELGNLANLVSLQLNYNKLAGGIQPALGRLTNLAQLELGNNPLGGTIPRELGDLTSLRQLELTTALLTGTIPPEIFNLAKLEELRLADNQLEGTITDVVKLTNLQVLELYFNRFSGSIPAGLRNLKNLRNVGVNGNAFTGEIPGGVGDLTGLTSFDVGSNHLTGSIPSGVAALENLEYLDLGNNELTGSLPDFAKLGKLRYLNVERNFLSGAIPSSIGGLTSIVDALFTGNSFTGPLPREIANWTNAEYLSFSDNLIDGAIPAEIANLKKVYVFSLGSNRFSGTIPREIGEMAALQNLDLSYNALRGPIPSEIRNLTNLLDQQSDFRQNLLFTNDEAVRAFVNAKQGGGEPFEPTQTVPPTGVQILQTTDRSATLTWTPIAYNYDGGGYQVAASTTPNGAPSVIATTNTKDIDTIVVRNLNPATTYFFTVSTVTHPHDSQKNLLVSDPTAPLQTTTGQRVIAPPDVAMTEAPEGMVRVDGSAVVEDSFTLTNFGDSGTNLTIEIAGDFFTVEPEQFRLEGGASRTIAVRSRSKDVGSYWGNVIVRGDGAEFSIDIVLLAVARPAGTVVAMPLVTRVEVVGERGLESVGTVQFRNIGTATLTGIVLSDQPWIVPNPQPISIEPGSVGTVNFRVIRSRRPTDAEGALVANLSLVYVDGNQASLLGNIAVLGPGSGGVSVSKVSVVDVSKPPVTSGSVPPTFAGEVPLFIAGLANRNNTRSDVSILNASGGGSINDLKLYFTSGSATNIASLSPLGASNGVSLTNIVGNLYNVTNGAGTLQVRSGEWQSVGAEAKTTVVTAGGTLGGSIPVFRGDRAALVNQRICLAGLTRPGDLVVQETSGTASRVRIEFFDANGNAAALPSEQNVGAQSLLELRDSVPAGAVAAIVTNLASSSGIVAYARAADAASGDAWSVVDWSALYRYERGGAVRVPFVDGRGAGGGKRRSVTHATKPQPRTDVMLFNPGKSEAKAKLQVIDTSGGLTEREVTIGAMKTALVPGVGANASTTTAHLIVTPLKGELAVTARSFASAASGTVGTAIPVLSATAGLRLGQRQIFFAIEDSTSGTVAAGTPATFRTSYGLSETSGASVRVRASIVIDETHALVSATTSRTFELAPRQQIVLPELLRSFAGSSRDSLFGDLHDLKLEIEVIEGNGSVVPFVIVTDNGTNDSVLRLQ